MRATALHDDRGSLPLAILLVVMVSSLIPLVATMTLAEQRVTRGDRDSGIALEAADAGLQDARYRLINRLVQPTDPLPVTVSGSVNGVPFTWSGRPDPALSARAQAAGLSWLVVSKGGHPGGRQRTVRAYLTQRSLFQHGVFLNNSGYFNGNNRVDSYRTTPTVAYGTGLGSVGSNDTLEFQGDFLADRVHLYDWTANPGAARCTASGNSHNPHGHCTVAPVTGPTSTKRRINVGPRFPLPNQLGVAENQLSNPSCPQYGNWTASSLAAAKGSTATFNLPAGTPLCFTSLTFDRHTVFPPSTQPYKLYVSGQVTVLNGRYVNCSGCATYPPSSPPDATRVLIITPATGFAFTGEADARIAAAVYAPRGTCRGGGGAVELYGSMMCESGSTLGGWRFHYDEAVGDLMGTGEFVVTRWDESPGATVP